MSATAAPIQYKNDSVAMPPKETYPKEAIRYVACLVDFIIASDKIQLASVGARSGGLRVGASDTEGCPTMFRTDYMIRRGCFTPLEPTAVVARSDERTIDNKWVGQRQALPGNDMMLLGDDSYREMGVVELTSLRKEPWGTNKAMDLNRHFFPEIDEWLSGVKAFPTLLAEYEEIVRNAQIATEEHQILQQELLNSARIGRQYMLNQIQANRARIEATKAIDMAGFTIGWQPRTRLFAEQLGITLENENEIKAVQTTVTNTESPEMISLKERELALKERELALLERQEQRATGENTPTAETIVPDAELCAAIKANGEQCTKVAVKDGRCQVPAHQLNG